MISTFYNPSVTASRANLLANFLPFAQGRLQSYIRHKNIAILVAKDSFRLPCVERKAQAPRKCKHLLRCREATEGLFCLFKLLFNKPFVYSLKTPLRGVRKATLPKARRLFPRARLPPCYIRLRRVILCPSGTVISLSGLYRPRARSVISSPPPLGAI